VCFEGSIPTCGENQGKTSARKVDTQVSFELGTSRMQAHSINSTPACSGVVLIIKKLMNVYVRHFVVTLQSPSHPASCWSGYILFRY
jgi:hypothetical protein